jgi:hypothetical protein
VWNRWPFSRGIRRILKESLFYLKKGFFERYNFKNEPKPTSKSKMHIWAKNCPNLIVLLHSELEYPRVLYKLVKLPLERQFLLMPGL